MGACPSDSDLDRFHAHEMDEADAERVRLHLAECAVCARRDGELVARHDARVRQLGDLGELNDTAPAERGTATQPADGPQAVDVNQPMGLNFDIEGYEIVRELHRGGQGVVYQAIQKSTKRKVAIKVLLEGPHASRSAMKRFEREIELVAQLKHPNIIAIFDSGRTRDGHQYCVMDYIRGVPLDQHVREKTLETDSVVKLFAGICSAVGYAHGRGVIHRDLKPSNILVDSEGAPKVLDFGLAKQLVSREGTLISLTGQVVGTLPYMSPEQAQGDPDRIDMRTDIYALGVILYQLLTDRFPYEVVGNMRDVLDNIMKAEPRRPSTIRRHLKNDVETIVLKALSKEPERRYQSAEALGRDLLHYIQGEPIDAKRDSGWYVIRKKMLRHRRAIAVGFSLVLIVAAGAVATLHYATKSREFETQLAIYEAQGPVNVHEASYLGLANKDVEPPPEDRSLIQREATIAINAPGEPVQLNPLSMDNFGEVYICELIFERLFWRTNTLDLVPNEHLIAAIDPIEDPQVRIVRLQPDLYWHDGVPLTAHDIVFSWQQVIREEVDASRSKRAQSRQLAEVIPLDNETVQFVLKKSIGTWQLALNFELVPKHLFKPGMDEDPSLQESGYFQRLHRRPVGCGPFRFVAWNNDHVLVERWEDYPSKLKPCVRNIVVRWIAEPGDLLSSFLGGDLDICRLSDEQFRIDAFLPEFRKVGERANPSSNNIFYVIWNCDPENKRSVSSPRIRRALAHAIDCDRIITQVTNNLGARSVGPFPVRSSYCDPELRVLKFNSTYAKRELADMGWLQSNDQPSQEARRGADRTLDIMVVKDSGASAQIAEIIQDDLVAIGLKIRMSHLDGGTFSERLESREFGGAILPQAIGAPVDPALWRGFFITDGEYNFGGYSNPKVDKLFDDGLRLTDSHERVMCFREIHRLIYDDQPVTFLYHTPSLWAINKRLRGVAFSTRGPFLFDPGLRNWWIPKYGK